jgi:ABC-type amino acid transport substrate-binding protein
MRTVYLLILLVLIDTSVSAKTVTVLTHPLPVFSEVKPDGSMTGYSVDYASELLSAAGYTPNFRPLPFSRVMSELTSDTQVMATGIVRTPEREDRFFWIAPLTANVIGFYSTQQNKIEDIDNLKKPMSVAVLRDDYRSELLRGKANIKRVEVDSWQNALDLVLAKRVDSLFFSELGIALLCKKMADQCEQLHRIYTHSLQFSYMAMPKTEQNREIATALSITAQKFVKSQAFSTLSQAWVDKLQALSQSVSVVEGVVSLGKYDRSSNPSSKLWVITNLEPFFNFRDERGRLTGYTVELVRSILLEAGLQTEILSAPWQRLIIESKMKPDVLVFNLAKTPEREEKYHWITPLTENAYSVFTLKTRKTYNNLGELPKASRVAVLAGDFRASIIEEHGLIPVATETWKEAVETFLREDAEFLFFSEPGLTHYCVGREVQCSEVKKAFVYTTSTTYLALSKQGTSKNLVARLTDAAERFKKTEKYEELVAYWLSQAATQTPVNMHEHAGVMKLWEEKSTLP